MGLKQRWAVLREKTDVRVAHGVVSGDLIILRTANPSAYCHEMNLNDQTFEEKVILNSKN